MSQSVFYSYSLAVSQSVFYSYSLAVSQSVSQSVGFLFVQSGSQSVSFLFIQSSRQAVSFLFIQSGSQSVSFLFIQSGSHSVSFLFIQSGSQSVSLNKIICHIKSLTQLIILNYPVLIIPNYSPFFLLQVRFAALKVLEGFHTRLGEEFMVLLPESIPFLAELMEG